MGTINIKNLPRRIFTALFWPLIDLWVTLFANFMLVRFDAWVAIPSTALIMMSFNLFFFYLLSLEKELPSMFAPVLKQIKYLEEKIPGLDKGKNLAILAVYTISGPAMIGAPLIWLLGIKGKRAYALIVAGSIFNSILWVGGVYNLLWILVRDLIIRSKYLL